MILVDAEHNIGDVVYLKTDIDQHKRLVTGLYIRKNNTAYMLSFGSYESTHYDFEISKEIDFNLKQENN